ncbi:hypothetical protein [Jatrophihabitans sp.]|uniref:hypothetical protein n=1 Tax=Jatrophihabitans sp. TaxID=1932789 RepID=UPI0030C6D863|nr:hypothetical protein [Jatrophihabitans sp.]
MNTTATNYPLHDQTSEPSGLVGSIEMYTMHEALAREHMRHRQQEAARQRLASELAAANRWHYLERAAHAAYRRHLQRVERAAQVSAVAN